MMLMTSQVGVIDSVLGLTQVLGWIDSGEPGAINVAAVSPVDLSQTAGREGGQSLVNRLGTTTAVLGHLIVGR